jgi:hypothetical protein
MAEQKSESGFVEHDTKNWEYDCGPTEFKGEIASPYINSVFDNIAKQAFPEGRTAYQEERARKANR